MIQELVEYGKRVSKGKSLAFNEEAFAIDLVINQNGEFLRFIVGDEKYIDAEAITAKKGKARLLLDKSQEVLGVGKDAGNKHALFLEKLRKYESVPSLKPVFLFYQNEQALKNAQKEFEILGKKFKTKDENITFMVGTTRLLETNEIRKAIECQFQEEEQRLRDGRICSICGTDKSPILDEPHGMVKMPNGHSAGSALVSFNETAFESYGLKGNLNSSICRSCARYYVRGLKNLLQGHEVPAEDGKKSIFRYDHRINISDTTVVLFWTREDTDEVNPFIVSDIPDASDIKRMFGSIWNGNKDIADTVETNMFYSLTVSSAVARIAVRDWTAISLDEYKKNLADWFRDIEIENYKGETVYSTLRQLVNASQRDRRPGDRQKSDLAARARIGAILWNASVKGASYKIPLEILEYTLNRIWKGDIFTPERASLIKLIINRNTDNNMKSTLDESNMSVAYLCGRLFAVIESMQWKAMGNVNSSIKDRFFTAAASQPAYVFGTLLTKNVPIYQHKIGGYLAKELKELAGRISEQGTLPSRFSTIEQGEFALGYYFQVTNRSNKESDGNINQ